MKIYTEKSLSDFDFWSGAIETADKITEADKWKELETILEIDYPDGIDETELNDLLWFEPEWIFEMLGIGEEEENDTWEENEIDFSQYADFDSFCAGRDCDTCPFFHYVMKNKNFDCEEYFNSKYR